MLLAIGVQLYSLGLIQKYVVESLVNLPLNPFRDVHPTITGSRISVRDIVIFSDLQQVLYLLVKVYRLIKVGHQDAIGKAPQDTNYFR